jgi:hypothetical protein
MRELVGCCEDGRKAELMMVLSREKARDAICAKPDPVVID